MPDVTDVLALNRSIQIYNYADEDLAKLYGSGLFRRWSLYSRFSPAAVRMRMVIRAKNLCGVSRERANQMGGGQPRHARRRSRRRNHRIQDM
jgi:hypothetical protein